MRTVDFDFQGQPLHLFLNGAALFDFYDQFGTEQEISEIISGDSRKSFRATCWVLHKLAEQGELARRLSGYDREPVPSLEQLAVLLDPPDVLRARQAIRAAVRQGFRMEHHSSEGYQDLGLLELQKKNGQHTTRSQYLQTITQVLHLPLSAMQTLTPGEVADLVELEVQRGRLKRREG